MYLAQEATSNWQWPAVILILGLVLGAFLLLGAAVAALLEFRKTKIASHQDEDLRRLVQRYEHLTESSLDAQQRVATDVAELRSRTTSIEQILRTVE